MRESRRLNLPTLLAYYRFVLDRYEFKSRVVLSKGSYVNLPVTATHNDPDTTSDSEMFDGFRYYGLRQPKGRGQLHQFRTTQANILHFGHGKHACPGRFFASLGIKNILVKLIMDYGQLMSFRDRHHRNVCF